MKQNIGQKCHCRHNSSNMKFTVTVVSYKLGVVKDDQPVEDQQQGSPMT